jgi:hypothetical protein
MVCQSFSLLRKYSKIYFRYYFHFKVGTKFIVLSDQHLYCVQNQHEEWVVPLRDIKGVQFIPADIVIVILLTHYTSSSVFETPTNKRFIPLFGTTAADKAECIFNYLLGYLKHLKHPSVTDTESL